MATCSEGLGTVAWLDAGPDLACGSFRLAVLGSRMIRMPCQHLTRLWPCEMLTSRVGGASLRRRTDLHVQAQ